MKKGDAGNVLTGDMGPNAEKNSHIIVCIQCMKLWPCSNCVSALCLDPACSSHLIINVIFKNLHLLLQLVKYDWR